MTCRDLITDALGEIKVLAAGEVPSNEDITLGLTRLQYVSDIYLGADSPVLTLDSAVPGPDPEAFMYELAFRLCGPFSMTFTQEQAVNYKRARSRLLTKLYTPEDADVEAALLYLSLNRFVFDFATGA